MGDYLMTVQIGGQCWEEEVYSWKVEVAALQVERHIQVRSGVG